MSIEPFMMAIFCDDVRQEVGNKLSYLGIYGPNLIVPAFPTTLIKLCCVLTVRLPADAPPKSVIFRLLRDDEVVFEANLTPPDGAVETDALAGPPAEAGRLQHAGSAVASVDNRLIHQRLELRRHRRPARAAHPLDHEHRRQLLRPINEEMRAGRT